MTNKGIIAALLVVIALGGIVYVAMPKAQKSAEAPTGTAIKEAVTQTQPATSSSILTPSSNASNDEIVDYLVNDLVKDETTAAKAAIDASSPKPQETTVNLGAGI